MRPLRLILSSFMAATLVTACRWDDGKARWTETHGRRSFRHISASSAGGYGLAFDDKVYHYPGSWGDPWNQPLPHAAVAFAASASLVYYVSQEHDVRAATRDVPLPGSSSWEATELAVDENERLYVLSRGKAARVASTWALDFSACPPAVSIAAGAGRLYEVGVDGALRLGTTAGCEEIKAPAKLKKVAARGNELAVVDVDGNAYRYRNSKWEELPVPVVYREDGFPQRTAIAELAVSKLYLWALDAKGNVFLLSEKT